MDTARRTPTAIPTTGRRGPLLALALAASTALSVLAPAGAASSAATVDVVVTGTGTSVAAVADAVRAAGGVVRDALPLVTGVSAELPAGAVLAPAFSVVPNAALELASKEVATLKRDASPVRQALGLSGAPAGGRGVTIAVVDTGVADSAEFGSRLVHRPVDPAWQGDQYGHGTFVAGVAAGGGAADKTYAGVAPEAAVLDVRVADETGATDLVTVLKGLSIAQQAGADVVNLSLSSGSNLPYQIDPLTVALDRLWAAGIVVVVPTGNDGPGKASVTSPGTDPTLLTVGALDEKLTASAADDVVPTFSGRGPAPQGVAKPDLVAPGQSLVSVRATGSAVDVDNPQARVGDRYFRGSGTSFATAAVAGTAALMLSKDASLSPDQVKAVVRSTAYRAKGLSDVRDAGSGGLSVAAALAAPAPSVEAPDVDAPPAGDEAAWHAFLQALLDEDPVAAANSWSQLSPAAHKWAASTWAAHKWAASKWGANSWSAHKWAGTGGTEDEWAMRFWAAHKWAASTWATDDFVASKWAASKWAASKWAASKWADEEFAASKWADEEFAASKWAASKWAASKWAASKWAGDDWA